MGRRAIYITVEEKKKAQAKRSKKPKPNEEKYTAKKKQDHEYQQRMRDQEKLRKHLDSLALLADAALREKLLQELLNNGVTMQSSAMVDHNDVTEIYAPVNENMSTGR
jgi:hypothetical protein